jgi:type VI secretion system protein ImpM
MSGLAAFAFGKLPAHGDFVARGLAPAECAAWDAWSSEALTHARDVMGEAFEATHAAALPWRFAFRGGPFGPGRLAGAIAPSMDRSGRRFVFVLGARAPAGLAPNGAGGKAAERLETEIYQAIVAAAEVDTVVCDAAAALAEIDAGPDATVPGRFWLADAAAEICAEAPPTDLLATMLLAERGAVA